MITIYIDLDDTLADTSTNIKELFNYSSYIITHHPFRKSFKDLIKDFITWKHIQKNTIFWENIPLTKHALDIYEQSKLITPHVKILTALPKAVYRKNSSAFKEAEKAKRVWLKKHFPQISYDDIIVCHAIEKHLQVKKTLGKAVLIDDSLKNIQRWKEAGGVGLHLENSNNVDKLFQELKLLRAYHSKN